MPHTVYEWCKWLELRDHWSRTPILCHLLGGYRHRYPNLMQIVPMQRVLNLRRKEPYSQNLVVKLRAALYIRTDATYLLHHKCSHAIHESNRRRRSPYSSEVRLHQSQTSRKSCKSSQTSPVAIDNAPTTSAVSARLEEEPLVKLVCGRRNHGSSKSLQPQTKLYQPFRVVHMFSFTK